MEKHLNVVAALQIGFGIFWIVMGCIVFFILSLIGGFTDDKDAQFILTLIGQIIAAFLFLTSIPGVIAGIALLRRKEWGRILTLILSVIGLMNFPVGTAVGIYSIWTLVQEETISLFRPAPKEVII